VSGLIVAQSERGKSTEAQHFEGKGIAILQDTTSYGIDRFILEKTPEDRAMLHHIIISDLEKLAARIGSFEKNCSKMRILMEEGLEEICTGRDRIHFDKPIQIGFLMYTTPDDIGDKRSV
jgi:hypothetical protein